MQGVSEPIKAASLSRRREKGLPLYLRLDQELNVATLIKRHMAADCRRYNGNSILKRCETALLNL